MWFIWELDGGPLKGKKSKTYTTKLLLQRQDMRTLSFVKERGKGGITHCVSSKKHTSEQTLIPKVKCD